MKLNWDQRYQATEYAYGKQPNLFFKEWIEKSKPGKILMPADGEGRNGVYAAMLGWEVTSTDQSIEGRKKAFKLAEEKKVTIDYEVGDFAEMEFPAEYFDAVGLIYAHFPASHKSEFHQRLSSYLKPGGVVILEGYSKNHLALREQDPRVGGPANLDQLFSKEEIEADFRNCEVKLLEERQVQLNEGAYHNGLGSVIRFIGAKR